jgi:2'-5' RNA ligase
MKAAIALILEGEAHDAVRRTTLELQSEGGFRSTGVLLPAHVSLKHPFFVPGVAEAETFFDRFASSLNPIALTLTTLEFWTLGEIIIAFLDVQEDTALRTIHNRLNLDLELEIGDTDAQYDGMAYHFHATTAIDRASSKHLETRDSRTGERFDITTSAQKLGLLVYGDDDFALGSCVCYKTVALEGARA